jgi:hypothetical protein
MKQMIYSDEFKKYDYGSDAANFKKYGMIEPPHYDLDKVSDFNIVLVCGKSDKLSVQKDYVRAKALLEKNNQVKMLEYECGHIGLIMPKDQK